MTELILASASPRREELLSKSGINFEIIPSSINENNISADTPQNLVMKLAFLKAQQVAKENSGIPVLGADTIVVLENEILGKPSCPEEAVVTLEKLQGKTHQVFTGVAIVEDSSGKEKVGFEGTTVWMRSLTKEEIIAYVATGESLDKAGAYGIQDKGSFLIEKIHGCYFNVVGLPLNLTATYLKEFGLKVL